MITSKFRKNIILASLLGILIIVLPVLIILSQKTQVFKTKALGENSSVEFLSSASGFEPGDPPSTTSENVTIKLTYASSSTPSNTSPTTPPNSEPTDPPDSSGSFNCTVCLADLNTDGVVDSNDLTLTTLCSQNYPSNSVYSSYCAVADFNNDSQISQDEMDCVASMVGQACNQ